MESSAKIMKATGIIHIVHGIIMLLLSFMMMILAMSNASLLAGLITLVITGGISFFYIYIGYELNSLRNPNKMKNLLITSIILAGFEIAYAMLQGGMAGLLFVVELIMSIVAICNLDSYKEYKGVKTAKKVTERDTQKSEENLQKKRRRVL